MKPSELVLVLLFLAALALGVWINFFADCSSIGWVPVREMPMRCLP